MDLTELNEFLDYEYQASRIRPFPVPLITNIEFHPEFFVQALDRGKNIDISANYPNLLNDLLRRKKYDIATKLIPAYPIKYPMSVFIFNPTYIIQQLMERLSITIITDYTNIIADDQILSPTTDMIMNSIDNIREFQLPTLSILFSPKYILLIKYYALLQIPIDVRLKIEQVNVNRIVYNPVMYGIDIHNADTLDDRLKAALNDGRIDEARRLYNEGGRYDRSYNTLASRYSVLALYVEGVYPLNAPDDAFMDLINDDLDLEYCIRPIFNQFWDEVTNSIPTILNMKVIDWMITNRIRLLTFDELLDRLSRSKNDVDDTSYYLEYCDKIVNHLGNVTYENIEDIIYLMNVNYEANDNDVGSNLQIIAMIMELLLDMNSNGVIRIDDYYGIHENIDFILNRLNIRYRTMKRAKPVNDEMDIE